MRDYALETLADDDAVLVIDGETDKPMIQWIICPPNTRIGQKGGHAYVWAPIGSRPVMKRDNRHTSAYLFGAICPERGVGAAIIMPGVNAEVMAEHLKRSAHRSRLEPMPF